MKNLSNNLTVYLIRRSRVTHWAWLERKLSQWMTAGRYIQTEDTQVRLMTPVNPNSLSQFNESGLLISNVQYSEKQSSHWRIQNRQVQLLQICTFYTESMTFCECNEDLYLASSEYKLVGKTVHKQPGFELSSTGGVHCLCARLLWDRHVQPAERLTHFVFIGHAVHITSKLHEGETQAVKSPIKSDSLFTLLLVLRLRVLDEMQSNERSHLEMRNSWQQTKHIKRYSNLLHACKYKFCVRGTPSPKLQAAMLGTGSVKKEPQLCPPQTEIRKMLPRTLLCNGLL